MTVHFVGPSNDALSSTDAQSNRPGLKARIRGEQVPQHRGDPSKNRRSPADRLFGRRLVGDAKTRQLRRCLLLLVVGMAGGLIGLILLSLSERGDLVFSVGTFLASLGGGLAAAGLVQAFWTGVLRRRW